MKPLIVVLKNLSAAWIGCYGNEWVATPNLDRLAAEGIVFERHLLDRIGAFQSDSYAPEAKRFDDLVPPWNVPADLFDVYAEEFPGLKPVCEPGPIAANDLDSWDALRASYAAVLTRLDAKLGKFLEESRGSDTAIVVTSDHGFPLGEHGIVGSEGAPAHAELVHLPLILWRSDRQFAGERVDRFTVASELTTILKHACESTPTWFESLKNNVHPFVRTLDSNGRRLAIRTDSWTVVLPSINDITADDALRSAKLYVYPDDRHEQNDLADRRPEIVEELLSLGEPPREGSSEQPMPS